MGLIELMGADRVVFGSDYPHPEGMAEPLTFVDELEGLPRRRRGQGHGRQPQPAHEARRGGLRSCWPRAQPFSCGGRLWRTSSKGRSRSAAYSRGMPRTRSLMMLRCISLLPPPRRLDLAGQVEPAPCAGGIPVLPGPRARPGDLQADVDSGAHCWWRRKAGEWPRPAPAARRCGSRA